jgi:predicted amidophosphoribosyltransferase
MTRRKQSPPLPYEGEPQRDLVADCGITCPTCGGPFRAAVKVCRKCGKPIGRAEKWRMVPASPGLVALEHTEPCGGKGAC